MLLVLVGLALAGAGVLATSTRADVSLPFETYLPLVVVPPAATPTATGTAMPSPTPTVGPTPMPTVPFSAITATISLKYEIARWATDGQSVGVCALSNDLRWALGNAVVRLHFHYYQRPTDGFLHWVERVYTIPPTALNCWSVMVLDTTEADPDGTDAKVWAEVWWRDFYARSRDHWFYIKQ